MKNFKKDNYAYLFYKMWDIEKFTNSSDKIIWNFKNDISLIGN